VRIRNAGLTVTVGVISGFLAAANGLSLLGFLIQVGTGRLAHVVGVAVAETAVFAALLATSIRTLMAGIAVGPRGVKVRRLTETLVVAAADVAGVVVQPVLRGRAWRAAVVTRGGGVIATPWTAVRRPRVAWLDQIDAADARAVAVAGPGPRAHAVLEAQGRLVPHPPDALRRPVWQPPAGWPIPPQSWCPPPWWRPPPDWPPPPPDWQWWGERILPVAGPPQLLGPDTVDPPTGQPANRWLGRETVIVMAAFLVPSIAGAVVGLIEALVGGQRLDNFALPVPGHATVSLLILIISYVPLAAAVPVALLLLARTGQLPRDLGLGWRGARRDAFPAIGIAIASFASVALVSLILSPLLNDHSVSNTAQQTHVPAYFVIYALVLSATTAVTEEVFVNGYLLTRLSQLGWRPWASFALSLTLRTSYHAYYGAAILVTVPFGYLVTRSFQKHGRLARPILAHFLYDATVLTIAVLAS
jgi:membrane protease YdiL (CAAX protease family)